jgi:hypothetical protein
MAILNRLISDNNVWLYLITLLGATSTYVFSLNKGFAGATSFLQRIFPGRSDAFYARLDFFLVTFIGSGIAFILFGPVDNPKAVMAGLGWVSAVNVALKK